MNETPITNSHRPYHICPDCSAYNAKANPRCWRCERDMSAGALQPKGVMGFRLAELEKASAGDGRSHAEPQRYGA